MPWDWLIVAAFIVWLVLRNLRVPEQPAWKWAIFPAFAVAVAGVWSLSDDRTVAGVLLLLAGTVGVAGFGLWDWMWRNANGYSTLW